MQLTQRFALAAAAAATAVAVAVAAGGCGGSSGNATDARAHDAPGGDAATDAATPFGCLGQPTPTTAPDPVVLSGTTNTITGTSLGTVGGVTVKALHVSDNSEIATTTSDGSGTYSLSMATGGNALDVYLRASLSGDRDTTLFPATSLYANSSAGYLVIISQDDFNFVAADAGEDQQDSEGAVAIAVLDCLGNAVSGATVTSSTGGDIVYVANDAPDTSATMTDTSGVALVFNVPAGHVDIGAKVGAMTLRTHTIDALAGVTTIAVVQP